MISRPLIPSLVFVACLAAGAGLVVAAETESGNLRPVRPTQEAIAAGEVSLDEVRIAGLRMFTTPFNRLDGYGDGPLDPDDTVSPGGRPTLQGNGTFLRVNGLDAQTCLECHSFVSVATSPPTLGIGGFGGSNANAIIAPTVIDPADLADLDGNAHFNGRFANPPFLFGAGGVELLGLEMTAALQALRRRALDNPDTDVDLLVKGVDFGVLRADADGNLDFSSVLGVDNDLVVKPFGRKGEFATIRDFDVGAMQFHFGMQPVEVVGIEDADGDGVAEEVQVGDLSALSTFIATLERPFMERLSKEARAGFETFERIGCVDCHKPSLTTTHRSLPLRFPEVPTAPWTNVFSRIDLTKAPVSFPRAGRHGIEVPLFADLKRHDMGEGLRESFVQATDEVNQEFTTARLWGVADTAPYLHDGRATTLGDAIRAHGGEAEQQRERFVDLTDDQQGELLAFLKSLRTPKDPAREIVAKAQAADRKSEKGNGHDHKHKPKNDRDDHRGRRKSHKGH